MDFGINLNLNVSRGCVPCSTQYTQCADRNKCRFENSDGKSNMISLTLPQRQRLFISVALLEIPIRRNSVDAEPSMVDDERSKAKKKKTPKFKYK